MATMFKTYLKFALRTFWKDRFYALLNIIGLAIGIAVSIIILLYLQSDLTYDQYHTKHRQIYRMVTNIKGPGVEFHEANTAREVAPLLQEEFPEVLSFVRIQRLGRMLVNVTEQGEAYKYNEEDMMRADSTVFDVFTYPLLEGNPKTALKEKNSIVLTAALAGKYFGNQEAVGKTLLLGDEKEPYTVTGVMEDLPDNSHLKFKALLSGIEKRGFAIQNGEFNSEAIWNPDVYTYLLFPEGYQTADFFAKLQPFYDKYIKPFGDKVDSKLWYYLEPLADIHFHSKQDYDETQGNMAYVYAFGGIGIFILLLACINYMNMATARSANRAKEIGMRKVLGSTRKALFWSFIGESLILSFIALILAVVLVAIVLYATPFNHLIEKELTLNLIRNRFLILGMFGITLFMGLVSGLYPALYLPAMATIRALKGNFKSSASGLILRKTLVILQFTISIAVVICTLLMKDQINYLRHQELGFNREQLLLVPIQDTLVQQQIPVIRNEMLEHSGILGATVAYHVPGVDVGSIVFKVETDSVMNNHAFRSLFVGKDYIHTLGIKLIAGRDFHQDLSNEVNGKSFIINETAAKDLGWYQKGNKGAQPEDALDKEMMFFHGETPGHVVGVVQDFNISSLHNAIEPTVLIPVDNQGSFFYFRLAGQNLSQTVDFIKEKWAAYDPNHPFEYSFLDQKFDDLYQADGRQSTLISILSAICLLISLLGILGLSAFTAEQRTKEIGVRKVLGATVPQIIYLLFSEVMYLVLVASLLAAPIAYFLIRYWLADFAYKTDMNLMFFLLAAGAALVIAFMTMSFHSLRSARKNPVVSFRYE